MTTRRPLAHAHAGLAFRIHLRWEEITAIYKPLPIKCYLVEGGLAIEIELRSRVDIPGGPMGRVYGGLGRIGMAEIGAFPRDADLLIDFTLQRMLVEFFKTLHKDMLDNRSWV